MIYKIIECEKSDSLLVIFSTFGMQSNFMQYGSLTNSLQFNVLFLANPEYTWYLGDDNISILLKNYVSKYGAENSYFVGSSMGAYGALLHGLQLNANIIASNPQVNKEVTLKHCNSEGMGKHIRNVEFVDIDNKFSKSQSCIYYMYGNFPMDLDNQKEFSKHQFNNVVFEHINIDKHTYFLCDVNDLYDRIDLLNRIRKFSISEGVKFE